MVVGQQFNHNGEDRARTGTIDPNIRKIQPVLESDMYNVTFHPVTDKNGIAIGIFV